MTRRDFEVIADVLATTSGTYVNPDPAIDSALLDYSAHLAHRMADRLATTNPRFDRSRFLHACAIAGAGV